MKLPLRQIAAIAAKFGKSRFAAKAARVGAGGLRKIGGGFMRVENKFRPTLMNADKLGKLAFRTDVAASAFGTGLTLYGAHLVNKDRKHIKKMQNERENSLSKFKSSLIAPSRRVRRLKEKY